MLRSVGDLDALRVAHVYRRKHRAAILSSLTQTHTLPLGLTKGDSSNEAL